MPIWLPLSADNWDTHQELDKQFGKWFGSDSPLEYTHLHAFDVSCRYAQSVPVWLTSVSCSSSSTCLSSCLASAPTATQTCSSNTYITISCGKLTHKGALLILCMVTMSCMQLQWPCTGSHSTQYVHTWQGRQQWFATLFMQVNHFWKWPHLSKKVAGQVVTIYRNGVKMEAAIATTLVNGTNKVESVCKTGDILSYSTTDQQIYIVVMIVL